MRKIILIAEDQWDETNELDGFVNLFHSKTTIAEADFVGIIRKDGLVRVIKDRDGIPAGVMYKQDLIDVLFEDVKTKEKIDSHDEAVEIETF